MTVGVLPGEWERYYEAWRSGALATPPHEQPQGLLPYERWLQNVAEPEPG